MKRVGFSLLLLVVLTAIIYSSSSCSDKKQAADTLLTDTTVYDTAHVDTAETIIAETPMPKAADELFDDFFFNFAANKKLQRKRIQFPLSVNRFGKAEQWQASQWKTDHFFMRQEYYTLIFDNPKQMDLVKDTGVSHVVLEKIYLTQNMVKKYFFDRIQGQWMLTALTEERMHSNTNTSFLHFYQKFAVDTAFQKQSMDDLVTFTAPDPDDDFNTITGTITPEQWPTFKPQLIPGGIIYNIIYGQKYSNPNRKYFVVRGISNSFQLEMDFRKKQGKWKLVKFNN